MKTAARKSSYSFEFLLWLISLSGLFILSRFNLQSHYNHVYHIILLLSLLSIIQVRLFKEIIFSRYVFFLSISIVILFLYVIIDYGDELGLRNLKILTYSMPFFVMGLRIGISNSEQKFILFIGIIVVTMTAFALRDAMMLGFNATYGLDRKVLAMKLNHSSDLEAFIMHYPTLSVATLLSFGIYQSKSKFLRTGTIACQIILTYSIIISTWTGATILLLLGMLVIFIIFLKKNAVKPIEAIASILIAVCIFMTIMSLIKMAQSGRGKLQAERISALVENLIHIDRMLEVADDSSGGRITLAKKSIQNFADFPLYGIGPRFHQKDVEREDGGHSFIFDTLAYYGIIGGIPIFLMLYTFVSSGLKLCNNKSTSWQEAATLSVLVSTVLGCFYNPYLIHSRLDFLFFFAAGYISGKFFITSNYRYKTHHWCSVKNRINSNRFIQYQIRNCNSIR